MKQYASARDDDEACSRNETGKPRTQDAGLSRVCVACARGKTGFGGSLWDTSILNKRITLDHRRRRLNPRLFRWARFCCTSRWMSSFDSGAGFFLRPTFAVALTDLTSL